MYHLDAQTFLSEELSEEIQIQGRTARQGKRGSYQLVLLEPELESQFGVPVGEKDKIPRKDLYNWLCSVRLLKHSKRCKLMEENLLKATEKDSATHNYFDHLLAHNITEAKIQFESLYRLVKKSPMPSSLTLDIGFAIDVTGSMAPYSNCVVSTTASLIAGPNSILEKLKSTFPEIEFKLRVGCLGFRDIADKNNQFQDKEWNAGGHFTDNIPHALQCIKSICGDANGGADIAEDHIAAIYHCSNNWNHTDDWTSEIKCLILFSDAPSHGFVAPLFSGNSSYDNYPANHPDGLNMNDAISSLISKDIDLFFCSFDPNATARTEEELSQSMKTHPDSKSDHGITRIPMVPAGHLQTSVESFNERGRHIIFVLDESGSMETSWSGVIAAYRKYIAKRKQSQSDSDLVSVVQFDNSSRITVTNQSLLGTPGQLSFNGGGTSFHPAALDACKLARETPLSHSPIIIFMSDGEANDAYKAAREFSTLNGHITRNSGKDLELHVIAFGNGAMHAQLEEIARASKAGQVHASANVADLASVFVEIATNENVATVLESEIAKRMSEAISDKLSLEYFRS
jgi:Mg-chelatase subunit ChlD